MRGKQSSTQTQGTSFRITPADAGKTQVDRAFGPKVEDHPRGCGENLLQQVDEHALKGSPPRMRGKLSLFSGIVRITGITPADAGKTSPRKREHVQTQDHPRGCGENMAVTNQYENNTGSPPRMRGKPEYRGHVMCEDGITPADAGKTERVIQPRKRTEDHPRGCGENMICQGLPYCR